MEWGGIVRIYSIATKTTWKAGKWPMETTLTPGESCWFPFRMSWVNWISSKFKRGLTVWGFWKPLQQKKNHRKRKNFIKEWDPNIKISDTLKPDTAWNRTFTCPILKYSNFLYNFKTGLEVVVQVSCCERVICSWRHQISHT